MNYEDVHQKISLFLDKYIVSNPSIRGVTVGLSGGIDSAVVASLASSTLGNKQVLAILMPELGITSQRDVEDAFDICSKLNIPYKIIPINDIKNNFLGVLDQTNNNIIKGNLSSRIRMCILYYYSALYNRIVLGTSNKTELLLGYFTKYGDGASDLLPIGDLYKTQIMDYAKFLNIPSNIIEKQSSAGLWNDQITENELGLSFDKIDRILQIVDKYYYDENPHLAVSVEIIKNQVNDIPAHKVQYLLELVIKNRHKLRLPLICKL
jgi:NAD+ synthase